MYLTVRSILMSAAFAACSLQVAMAQAPPSTNPTASPEANINDANLSSPIETNAPSPLLIKAQILLDRAHASPGVIETGGRGTI